MKDKVKMYRVNISITVPLTALVYAVTEKDAKAIAEYQLNDTDYADSISIEGLPGNVRKGADYELEAIDAEEIIEVME